MNKAKCPVCGCKQFYVKNPEDEFEVYVFTCENGDVCFDTESNESDTTPSVEDETETYCNACAWHDRFKTIKIDFK
jgi:hypothetical protein